MHRSLGAALMVSALASQHRPPRKRSSDLQRDTRFKPAASASSRVRCSTQYFNQITPENGGQVGRRRRNDAHRGDALGSWTRRTSFAQANGFKFNFHVLLWGNQQPTWMATLPARGAAGRDQEVVRGGGRALPGDRVAPGGQRAACRTRRTASTPKNAGSELQRERQLRPARSAAPMAPTARAGTGSSTPSGWRGSTSRTPKLMLNDVQHHQHRQRDRRVPEDHQHPQAPRT